MSNDIGFQHLDSYSNIRVDKNFAENIKNISKNYKKDAAIIKAILMYMAYDSQKDLFGFYKIDPQEFADTMFFQKTNLFRMHPNPKQLLKKGVKEDIENEKRFGRMSEHRMWKSNLENALYILSTESVVTDYKYKVDTKSIGVVERFNFIDKIEFELEYVGRTKKIIYKYKPNPKFEENLKTYFSNVCIKKYGLLKKPKLEDAYVDLLNQINNQNVKGLNTKAFKLEIFADIMSIKKHEDFSNYKSKINTKFERLKAVVGDDVKGLKLIWGKSSDHIESTMNALIVNRKKQKVKYDNIPILTWDRVSQNDLSIISSKLFKTMFRQQLFKGLSKICFSKYKDEITHFIDQEKIVFFYEWILSSSDLDIKLIKYKDTFIDIYKSTNSLPKFSLEFKDTLKALSNAYYTKKTIILSADKIILNTKRFSNKKFNHFYELMDFYYANCMK